MSEEKPLTTEQHITAQMETAVIPLDKVPFTFKTLQAIANTDFVPKALRNKPNAILASILTGRELGLGPMESLRSIDVIDGRPSPSAEWMVGRILEAGHFIGVATDGENNYLQSDVSCTVLGEREIHGQVVQQVYTFTMDMAQRAGLTEKYNWKAYPEAMLYWRAVAQLSRQFFADVLRGIKHLPEEIGADTWEEFGYVPTEGLPEEGSIVDKVTGEMTEEVTEEITEAEIVAEWPPTPTGEQDRAAIDTVESFAGPPDDQKVWNLLIEILENWERWTGDPMPETQANVRLIFRAMEFLNVWEGENTMKEELTRVSVTHLTDFNKADLTKFARNMVMKAQVATKDLR